MSDEVLTVANVVGLVVFGVGEDHEDAIGGEVMHLAPQAGADEQALSRGIEYDAFLATTIKEAEAYGTSHADAQLAKFPVRMEAAADARGGSMDPINSSRSEGQDSAQFGYCELPAGVASLRDIDELDER
jgi:hypothetical protein